LLRPQEEGPVGRRIEKGAVVAGDDDGRVARQHIQPVLELRDLFEIEMVGRLVEQQHIGFIHPCAGDQCQPLPAAAELPELPFAQLLGYFERFQHDIRPPAFAFGLVGRKGVQDGVAESGVEKG